jgi:hypothetical protein
LLRCAAALGDGAWRLKVIHEFCNWLGNTPLSLAIQNAFWVIPTVQTVHILAIAVVMSSVAMLDLRVLGVGARFQSIPQMAHRFLPWVWGSVLVLLASGTLLIIGEPGRELESPVFWLKMSMLVCVLAITAVFQYLVKHRSAFWEQRRVVACAMVLVSLVLWIGIVSAGRWIAYVEHG